VDLPQSGHCLARAIQRLGFITPAIPHHILPEHMRCLRLLPVVALPIFIGGSCALRSNAVALSDLSCGLVQTIAARTEAGLWTKREAAMVKEEVFPKIIDEASASVMGKLHQQVCGWAAEEPEAAMAYLTRLPDAGLRDKLVCIALRQWASGDIAAASDWAMRNGGSPTERAFLLRESICGLAAQDPAEALLWFALMTPDVRVQFDGSEGIRWETYLRQSPADAASRIPELPASVLKNQLASAFARTLASKDSLAAQFWAEELADPAARRAALAALRPS
jgi:hypothetical protein